MSKIYNIPQSDKNIFIHTIPSIIAILIAGIIDIEISLNHPYSNFLSQYITNPNVNEILKRISWNILQLIPALGFGFISDHHQRKKTLIFLQIVGVIAGLLLLIFGFNLWVTFLTALTFNPLSVARASILDNFPKASALKIIAITFIARNASWLFIDQFLAISSTTVLCWMIPIQIVNVILIKILSKDKFEDKNKMKIMLEHHAEESKDTIKENRLAIIAVIMAFAFAETTFYLTWIFLETRPVLEKWLSFTTLATFFGTGCAMLYRKIPHFTLITILYSSLGAMTIITLLFTHFYCLSYEQNLLFLMTLNCVIGGLYLPFVADALIVLSGSKRKATGSAFSEVGDTIALALASLLAAIELKSPLHILLIITPLYILAAIFQRYAEKKANIS